MEVSVNHCSLACEPADYLRLVVDNRQEDLLRLS